MRNYHHHIMQAESTLSYLDSNLLISPPIGRSICDDVKENTGCKVVRGTTAPKLYCDLESGCDRKPHVQPAVNIPIPKKFEETLCMVERPGKSVRVE